MDMTILLWSVRTTAAPLELASGSQSCLETFSRICPSAADVPQRSCRLPCGASCCAYGAGTRHIEQLVALPVELLAASVRKYRQLCESSGCHQEIERVNSNPGKGTEASGVPSRSSPQGLWSARYSSQASCLPLHWSRWTGHKLVCRSDAPPKPQQRHQMHSHSSGAT